MALQSREGSRIPDVDLYRLRDGAVQRVSAAELFGNRRIIVFALPGAFTPTCSTAHVPGYVARADDFKKTGIQDIVCLSVNDPYVMDAWQDAERARGITFVADPEGEFTRQMGMLVDKRDAGLGMRSWRYSMLVNDGRIEKMFIEPQVPGDPFEVSDAETMLKYLRPKDTGPGAILMLARHGCPHCRRAKQMLNERGLAFEAVHVGDELSMRGVAAAAGKAQVPQVFIDGRLIGGADQLARYLEQLGSTQRTVKGAERPVRSEV
ncbi:MAG TPA: glutathione peroxidase [Gemmatimonadaceae bacterium]|jgi:peroxiredoxin/glutaredoxin|nr:glutathione peroxidase [Gemmatimonadaceae bacterium]